MISDFDFTLVHKSGKLHSNADGLSRAATEQGDMDPALVHVEELTTCSLTELESSSSDEDWDCSGVEDVTNAATCVCEAGLAMEKLRNFCLICNKNDTRKRLLNCETCGS